MHPIALILRALVILALLGTASVPQGMMRAPGPDGARLVLCTPDGVKEIWLRDDGTVRPVEAPDRSDGGASHPHCVQVTHAQTASAPPAGLPRVIEFRPAGLILPAAQIDHPQPRRNATPVRAPPSLS